MNIKNTRTIRPRKRQKSSPDPQKTVLIFLAGIFAVVLISFAARSRNDAIQEKENKMAAAI